MFVVYVGFGEAVVWGAGGIFGRVVFGDDVDVCEADVLCEDRHADDDVDCGAGMGVCEVVFGRL